jgi:S1-C subfamily serine protease
VAPYCTGVWISNEHILTAHHCVSDEELEEIGLVDLLTFNLKEVNYIVKEDLPNMFEAPSKFRSAIVIGLDQDRDLALLKIVGEVPIHEIIVISNNIDVGEKLHIIGHVKGLPWTYMSGVVSALRTKDGVSLLQVSAPIYFGASGGGAFNESGDLVGITSFIYAATNVGFFIDSKAIKKFLSLYLKQY